MPFLVVELPEPASAFAGFLAVMGVTVAARCDTLADVCNFAEEEELRRALHRRPKAQPDAPPILEPKPDACPECRGTGGIRDDWFAGDETVSKCRACDGTGRAAVVAPHVVVVKPLAR